MFGVVFKGQHRPGRAEVNYLGLDAFPLVPLLGKAAAATKGLNAERMCLGAVIRVTARREKQNLFILLFHFCADIYFPQCQFKKVGPPGGWLRYVLLHSFTQTQSS